MGQLAKYCVGAGPVPVATVEVGIDHSYEAVVALPRGVPAVGPATQDPAGKVQMSSKLAVMVTLYESVPGGLLSREMLALAAYSDMVR